MTVRSATWRDLPALRTVCARAYVDNPLMRWALPDDATRADACAMWLGPSLERYLLAGHVDVLTLDDEVAGVAAWWPAGAHADVTTLPSHAAALRALVGEAHATTVLGTLAATRTLAPASAGAYLNYLAVDPRHQGRGHGGTLLRHGLTTVGAVEGTPWLATSDPRNVPFYGRHGFAVVGTHDLADGLPLAVMHAATRTG